MNDCWTVGLDRSSVRLCGAHPSKTAKGAAALGSVIPRVGQPSLHPKLTKLRWVTHPGVFSVIGETAALFEIAPGPNIIRRITDGLLALVKAFLRPLSHHAVRVRFLRDLVVFYVVILLLLHFGGYRSWYPQFHRVHETFHDAAISSVPLALFGAIVFYVFTLQKRDRL